MLPMICCSLFCILGSMQAEILLSSAYPERSQFDESKKLVRVLMYILNSTEPAQDPWGTENGRSSSCDTLLLICTQTEQSDK